MLPMRNFRVEPLTLKSTVLSSNFSVSVSVRSIERLKEDELKIEGRISSVTSEIDAVTSEIALCAQKIDAGGKVDYYMNKDILLRNKEMALINEKAELTKVLREKEAELAMFRQYEFLQQWKEFTQNQSRTSCGPPIIPLVNDFCMFRLEKGSYYVDKTATVEKLVASGYFKRIIFRRPRRFGKSLMLSTLKYFFYGATDLFKDTVIFDKTFQVGGFTWSPGTPETHDFPPCPVIHLDFSKVSGTACNEIAANLLKHLKVVAKDCGVMDIEDDTTSSFLDNLILELSRNPKNRWGKVVILIDEYDCLLRNAENDGEAEKVLTQITDIFRVIKGSDKQVQFCCVTGIQSNALAGLYSGANNFQDVTYKTELHDLCGCTEDETRKMLAAFDLEPKDESDFEYIRKTYNGYYFSLDLVDTADGQKKKRSSLFNPFFLSRYAYNRKLDDYWGQSASGSLKLSSAAFLGTKMPFKTSVSDLTNPLTVAESREERYLGRAALEAGYGTISSVDTNGLVTIACPNTQVEILLNSNYLREFYGIPTNTIEFHASVKALRAGDVRLFLQLLNRIIASLPNNFAECYASESDWINLVCHYCAVSSLKFTAEDSTMIGRSDIVVVANDVLYILEFKMIRSKSKKLLHSLENKALKQITDKNYGSSSFVTGNIPTCTSFKHVAVVCSGDSRKFVSVKIYDPETKESSRYDL